MTTFTETITEKRGSKVINLSDVTAAGYDAVNHFSGHCPTCGKDHAYVFTKNDEEFILACPHCGQRVKGCIGSTWLNEWVDIEVYNLEERRNDAMTNLAKKVNTKRKAMIKMLYR